MTTYSVEIKNITVDHANIERGETRTLSVDADDKNAATQKAIHQIFGYQVGSMNNGKNSDGSEYRTLTGKSNVANIYGKIYCYAEEAANA